MRLRRPRSGDREIVTDRGRLRRLGASGRLGALALTAGLAASSVGCSATPVGLEPKETQAAAASGARSSTPVSTSQAVTPRALTWTLVPMPAGVEPLTVTAGASDLLVSGFAVSERTRPTLHTLPGGTDGPLTTVPVTASSPYAFEARWLAVAVRGNRILAVGGARGGAHANYRWTVWEGTRKGLVEQPQMFGVFGGWGAGDLTGAAFAGREPVVSGAWSSDSAGTDVSLWRQSGDRWARRSSSGSPLASTATLLAGARSMTTTGAGLALAGSVTELGDGRVASVAALWTAPSADGPWALVRLPGSSNLADAHGARCDADRCLVVGQDGGVLKVWDVRGEAVNPVAVPPVPVASGTSLLAPTWLGRDLLVLPGELLVRTPGGWEARTGPEGDPMSADVVDGTLYVITSSPSGDTALWSAKP